MLVDSLDWIHHAKRSKSLPLSTNCVTERCPNKGIQTLPFFCLFACNRLMLLPYWCIRGTILLWGNNQHFDRYTKYDQTSYIVSSNVFMNEASPGAYVLCIPSEMDERVPIISKREPPYRNVGPRCRDSVSWKQIAELLKNTTFTQEQPDRWLNTATPQSPEIWIQKISTKQLAYYL